MRVDPSAVGLTVAAMAAASGSDQRIKKEDLVGPTIGGDRINPRAPIGNPSPWMTIVPGPMGGCREADQDLGSELVTWSSDRRRDRDGDLPESPRRLSLIHI